MIPRLASSRASAARPNDDAELVAHDWLTRIYEPITSQVPRELSGKLEPAELFHEVLEHRWYMAEREQHDVSIERAIEAELTRLLARWEELEARK